MIRCQVSCYEMDVESGADAFRLLFDDNPRPMFVSDHETLQIVTVNRAACELYGWSHDEFVRLTLRDIRPPEQVAYFEEAFADVSKTNERTYSRRGRHRTKDGRVLDVSLEITATRFGGRRASLAVVTDMTGIREAERRFKLLVEHSADGISLTTADNVVEYISPGGMRILGYEDSDFVGGSAGILTHPDDSGLWRAPACGETKHHVARMRHRDGSWRWIESTTTNLTHDPAVRAYVSNYRDITQRKLAEESLRKSETNFRTLIERAPIATFVHSDGHFVYVNSAAVALLGHRHAHEIVGRPVFDYVHHDAREGLARNMSELPATGTAAFTGLRLLRADASEVVIEGAAMLLDYDGVPAYVVMGHDVTERDALFARMAMADRMLSMGTLAAGVAHEINNPLAYITTNLELLAAELPNIVPSSRSRLDGAALRLLVGDAREGVARVNAIVRDLRSLSRPDEHRPGPVDVLEVLASSIKMTNNELRHRARVVQSYVEGLPPVDADPSRLGQVFVNLLLNAAQAIGDGQADRNEVRVRASATDGGRRVRVDIEDTGTGIPASIIGRVFDPFFTTKAPGAGMGLGLAISHQIVHAIGGDIQVESQPGVGSTFSVLLPVADVPTHEVTRETPAQRFTRRILLVDDEPAVGRSLQLLLAPEIDVVAVVRAADALDLLARGQRFDAILCDLMMPQSSGIQLYEQVAGVAPDYLGRMIFMTGGAFTTQAHEFLVGLGRPYLQKPFSAQQLRDALASVTNGW